MAPKVLPPPPHPDPVTLDQIYTALTTPGIPLDEKAYHLVALTTVAFHPSVKLFLFEDPVASATGAEAGPSMTAATLATTTTAADGSSPSGASEEAGAAAVAMRHQLRREGVLKSVASFLAQRNNAVCEECRWETVSLLGELCRMENTHTGPGAPPSSSSSPQALLEARLNDYARRNLEYLALLPWFRPAVGALLDAAKEGSEPAPVKKAAASSSSEGGATTNTTAMVDPPSAKLSREELKRKLHEKQKLREAGGEAAAQEPNEGAVDEDVVVALKDILNALPNVETDEGGAAESSQGNKKKCVWTPEALAQAHDLMFLDASTSMLHLIPTVSRCYGGVCAMCRKQSTTAAAGTGESSGKDGSGKPKPLLRCSSCKAVYYCSPECQRQHWALSHRQPCKSYKDRCATVLEEYYRVNAEKSSGKKRTSASAGSGGAEGVTVLEVPLEPSLFYETRRYLFDHRDASFSNVDFYDYFMKYAVRGS